MRIQRKIRRAEKEQLTYEAGRKDEFIVTASKPGYHSVEMPVGTRVAGTGAAGFAGNILLGGVVGMAVDAASGATLEHYPNPVMLTLMPLRKGGKSTSSIARRVTD